MSNSSNDGGYYGGGGYYYGEGFGGYSDAAPTPSRSFKDYLVMVRERIWWLVVSVFVFFLGSAVYTMNAQPEYESASSVQVLRKKDQIAQIEDISYSMVANVEDFNTQVRILESMAIIQQVDESLKGAERRAFLAPYEQGLEASLRGEINPQMILYAKRQILPQRNSLVINIVYAHPDKEIAAKVANYFAESFIDFNNRKGIETALRAVEDLRVQADQQMAKIKEMEVKLADFKEKYKTTSIDRTQDIDNEEFKLLNQRLQESRMIYDSAYIRWNQVENAQANGAALWEISHISTVPQVSQLQSEVAKIQIQVSTLAEKFRDKHPSMVAARQALTKSLDQLRAAADVAASGIYNEYLGAKANLEKAQEALDDKREEMILIDRIRPEYNELLNQIAVNQEVYQHFYQRMQEAVATVSTEGAQAQIIDYATPSIRPARPNLILNLGLGLFMGLAIGGTLVVVLAFLDDKIKTAFDIESTLGLPLIGIIPRITRIDTLDKARVVADNVDRQTVEAFRAIHSTLKLNEESRNAKVILTTSTVPSEGKSFVSTNMAITFAMHGERTIIIDGDLRMPNVAKSLDLKNELGILTYLEGRHTLDEGILRGYVPNLDVMVAGGRSRSPTQVLSSPEFQQLIRDLRTRYDKVVIDSPPLAPVSDALNMLPMADGVIYVIRFNTVKRKTARLNVRRLRESTIPVFGAILNNINTNIAGYYYSQYYDKSYKQYYFSNDLSEEARAVTTTENTPSSLR